MSAHWAESTEHVHSRNIWKLQANATLLMEGGSAVLENIKSPFISKIDFLEVKVPAVET